MSKGSTECPIRVFRIAVENVDHGSHHRDIYGYIIKCSGCAQPILFPRTTIVLEVSLLYYKSQDLLIRMDCIFFDDGIIPYEQGLRKVMYVTMSTTAVTLVIVSSLFGYGFFANDVSLAGVYDIALTPYTATTNTALDYIYKTVVLLMIVWNTVVSLLFICLFVIVCYILYKEFEYLCRTFRLKISSDGTFTDDLERFRLTHQSRL